MRAEMVQLRREQLELMKVIKQHLQQQQPQPHLQEQQQQLPSPSASSTSVAASPPATIVTASEDTLAEAAVPSSSLGRAAAFGGLVTRLAFDAGSRRVFGKRDSSPGVLSHKAVDLLVDRLCKMRGAALKLGQMLSIQDEELVPKHVLEAFSRVREQSYQMPRAQLEEILREDLGERWLDRFEAFDMSPVAAASLGQVHKGRLRGGQTVAVKVQFKGVAESIASDVANLRWLFSFGILPKGLYVENILRELQRELARECDYEGEAARQEAYRGFLEGDAERHGGLRMIDVPRVVPEASAKRVLTTEWVDGQACDYLFGEGMSQAERNEVGEAFLRITLKELFEWRMMQTDPSFANFMYSPATHRFSLIDFGAARTFDASFVEKYLLVVYGATVQDKQMVLDNSRELGFLTGAEEVVMTDAHVEAAYLASYPFATRGIADFKEFDLSSKMKPHVATMLKHRLTAPPLEIYSLHRRLNGCFQLMAKLGAQVDSRRVFIDVLRGVKPQLSPETAAKLDLRY
eukprot:Rhum_TRINITY_DN14116_c0_g1::Rhum_TRINITY_DN14116_c0_g1_i1::g.70014::m.70014/K08869/ADCK, ABC1; aarF domain-containing kinase